MGIKVYLLGHTRGFLLFFKRFSRVICNMIATKVLSEKIPQIANYLSPNGY